MFDDLGGAARQAAASEEKRRAGAGARSTDSTPRKRAPGPSRKYRASGRPARPQSAGQEGALPNMPAQSGQEERRAVGAPQDRQGDAPLLKLLFLPNYKIKFGKGGKNPQIEPEVWEEMYRNATRINLNAMGIYLFRNGFGFVWYELDPGPISSERLMEMQNYIKELNRSTKIRMLKVERKPVSDGAVVAKKVIRNKNGSSYEREVCLTPFFMGKMLVDTMRFLGVTFLTERRALYGDMLKTGGRFIEAFPYEKIEYSAGTKERAAQEYPGFPDKAVLFSYGYMINPGDPEDVGEEQDRCSLAFYSDQGICRPTTARRRSPRRWYIPSGIPSGTPAAKARATCSGAGRINMTFIPAGF